MKFSKFSSILTSVVLAFLLVAVVPYIAVIWWDASNYETQAVWRPEPDTGCGAGYKDWDNSSLVYNDTHQWSTIFIPILSGSDKYPEPKVVEQFADINSDGLPDYVFSFRSGRVNDPGNMQTVNAYSQDCVYLNTGTGWEPAYRCVMEGISHLAQAHELKYYGDCAA
jgi:hypothetical protein